MLVVTMPSVTLEGLEMDTKTYVGLEVGSHLSCTGPLFDPQHHINEIWTFIPLIPELRTCVTGDPLEVTLRPSL